MIKVCWDVWEVDFCIMIRHFLFSLGEEAGRVEQLCRLIGSNWQLWSSQLLFVLFLLFLHLFGFFSSGGCVDCRISWWAYRGQPRCSSSLTAYSFLIAQRKVCGPLRIAARRNRRSMPLFLRTRAFLLFTSASGLPTSPSWRYWYLSWRQFEWKVEQRGVRHLLLLLILLL